MASDATIETNVLQDLGKESIQARSRSSPWDSASAPGIGPGMDGSWFGGGPLFLGLQQAADEIVAWSYYPMMRDKLLRKFWKTESILAGAVYSFSARISSLPAKIKGPPRNKAKASEMMHALDLQKLVIDMLTTDNGFFIERVGPGRADKPLNPKMVSYLSVMDSAQVWRTFDPEYPAIYVNPYTGAYHKMHYSRIISGSSCPQPDELARGIGFCAVSRALRYSQIARDIEIYKHEKVGGRFTRAIGVVSGMTEKQFNANVNSTKELNDSMGFTRYAGIPWLVAVNQEIKASIVDLAHLPDGFDAEKDTETYVKCLALAFGTDVREFWPGQGGGASKADATVQHEKARGKGIADVTSTIERSLNWGVFDALDCECEFDYTDDAEQMATAQYHFQVITNVSTMQQSGNISPAQGTALLVNMGVIDPDVIKDVADAESSELADTEAPYIEETTPVQQPAAVPQQPPQLAKPPAAGPNTIGTPPGGIKAPPAKPGQAPASPGKPSPALPQPPKTKPLTPRMATSDMRPAKKEFASDEQRIGFFSNLGGSIPDKHSGRGSQTGSTPQKTSSADSSSVAEVKAVGNAPAHFHTATNDYESKLQALMTSFFAKGQPSSESELNTRLVQLIQGYMALSSTNIDNAFQTGFDHVAQGHKPSNKGLKAVTAIKRKSNKYFDGLIGDLKDAVMQQINAPDSHMRKEIGVKLFGRPKPKAQPVADDTADDSGDEYQDPAYDDTIPVDENGDPIDSEDIGFLYLASGFINRIGLYAGWAWNAIMQGLGDVLGQDNTEVERHLDPSAEHCETCPDKAGVYKSWDDMVAQSGVPGDLSDDCGSRCRCYCTGAIQ